MPYFKNFTILIVIAVFFSCKSQQHTTEQLPDKQLVFGSGGGFSGANDAYVLLENGQVFHFNPLTETYTSLKNIQKKEAINFFKILKTLELSQTDFNHPGNLYYFLEEVNGAEKHRVTWGSNDNEVDQEISTLYKDLKTAIK